MSTEKTEQPRVAILVIDDQKADRISARVECETIFGRVSGDQLLIEEASTIAEAFQKASEQTFNVILLDKDLGVDEAGGKISGVDQIPTLLGLQPHAQIIMLTGDENFVDIVQALKNGASDYLLKRKDLLEYRGQILQTAFRRSLDELERTLARQGPARVGLYSDFVCKSPVMQRLDQKICGVAEATRPILLLGPSGVGKGAVARRIHKYRAEFLKQSQRPFVNVNIGAMPDALAQSELFGQDAYSYTGSGSKMKPGLLDVAKNGDIFLDEVGDASPEMQLKLLKVVEERQFTRVGGRQALQTNARFIFATNKNIKELVDAGKFRADLYMRIAAFELEIPTLEERAEDLPEIIEVMLKNALADFPHKKITTAEFPEDLMRYLSRPSIPGNIRGIENDLAKLVAFAPVDAQGFPNLKNWRAILGADLIQKKKIKDGLSLDEFITAKTNLVSGASPGYKKLCELFEKKLLEEAISKTVNYTAAAKTLKMSKSSLSNRIRKLNIRDEGNERAT